MRRTDDKSFGRGSDDSVASEPTKNRNQVKRRSTNSPKGTMRQQDTSSLIGEKNSRLVTGKNMEGKQSVCIVGIKQD